MVLSKEYTKFKRSNFVKQNLGVTVIEVSFLLRETARGMACVGGRGAAGKGEKVVNIWPRRVDW